MSTHTLEEILHPQSIAVVGASGSGGRGAGFITPLLDFGFKGKIYPVNPKYSEVLGMKAYPTIKDIPDTVDFVISAVPAPQVLKVLEDCSQKGVKGIHLYTARFSETGRQDAIELEQEVLEKAKKWGIRIIGPNCMGVYYPQQGLSWSSDFPKEVGTVGLASQSGQAAMEIIEGLNDTHDSLATNRTNEVVRMLTVIATVLLPITVVASIFGMNIRLGFFEVSPYSVLYVFLIMLVIVGGMLYFFRRQHWI